MLMHKVLPYYGDVFFCLRYTTTAVIIILRAVDLHAWIGYRIPRTRTVRLRLIIYY